MDERYENRTVRSGYGVRCSATTQSQYGAIKMTQFPRFMSISKHILHR